MTHGELASLLWGGAFGFLWCYTALVRFFVTRHPLVRRPQGRLESVGGLLRLRAERPPVPAFFRWTLVSLAVHSPARRLMARTDLLQKETVLPLSLPRGQYEVQVWWELTDVFGLTRFLPRTDWVGDVTVEPVPLPFAPPPPPPTRPGPWRPRRAGRRAGDPFDVRPYLPGDDLRRLHWPLYAHSGVPFVRTAEPSPPPTGHQFLILDTEAVSEEILDDRLSRLVTWLHILDTQGTGWTLAIPSADKIVTALPGPVLATLSPAPLPDRPVDPRWPETVTLVTGPGSLGAARLARHLAATRRRYRPVVLPDPALAPEPRQSWWRRPS